MVDWNKVIDVAGENTVVEFAAGELPGNLLTELVSFTSASGEVRNLLRNRGVQEARRLARKAMTRRGYEFV